ncbi:trypsin-like peptidase domain-containing protein [Streptomyces griseus]|uniref:trypsin-like peptidase domain-containing protein n=1 Tax=Streptomyces griseus TaxID=1911 RepID=UPI0005632762|nr:trypsin-like peptidase domain-containing protein [Streptomyces griseus]
MTAHVRPATPDGLPAPPCPDPRAVRVSGPSGDGTGHLLDGGLLLTAARLVDGDGDTVVCRLPGESRHRRCSVVWSRYDTLVPEAVRLDAALLRVLDDDGAAHAGAAPGAVCPLPPLRWGRLATRRPAVPVRLTAFPGPGQDPAVLHGTVNAGSAAKAGRYHVTLSEAVPPAPAGGRSPWPGVPGAAVLGQGLVLGVVAEAVRESGPAWLSVVTAERLLRDPEFRVLVGPAALEAVELRSALTRPPVEAADTSQSPGPGPRETDQLARWCEKEAPFSVRLVVGADDGTLMRLARALVDLMGGRGWVTGFVAADAGAPEVAAVTDASVPVLLVVDQADSRPVMLRALLEAVARRTLVGATSPVRLLLLSAEADGEAQTGVVAGGWWWTARRESLVLRDLPPDTVLALSVGST